jgi:hypothetical protein
MAATELSPAALAAAQRILDAVARRLLAAQRTTSHDEEKKA